MKFTTRDRESGDWPWQVSLANPTENWLDEKKKINRWVRETFPIGDYWQIGGSWYFRNRADRTLFLLRWS